MPTAILLPIDNGQLKATYKPSDSTISFYVNDIDIEKRPLLTLRLSDHNPTYQNYVGSKRLFLLTVWHSR